MQAQPKWDHRDHIMMAYPIQGWEGGVRSESASPGHGGIAQPSHLLSCFFHTCVLVVAPCTLSVSYFRRQTKEVTVRLKPFKLGNFKREPQAKHGFCCRPSNKRYCSHRAVMADPWHIWGHAENWWCFIPVLLERQSKGTPENRLEISSGKSIVKRVSRGVKNKVANEYQVFLM